MNRKIKTYRAITYILLFYLAAACFLLGRCGILEKDRTVAGTQAPAGSVEARLNRQIQQVFLAEGTYLRYLELYVLSPESSGEACHLFVYDDQNEKLFDRDVVLPEGEVPGFLRIPVGIKTEPGRAYVWQLQGKDVPLELAWENTQDTGLVTFGNYYINENKEIQMQEARNIVMRLVYRDAPSAKRMAVLYAALILGTVLLIALAEYAGQKKRKLVREVSIQWVVSLTVWPVLMGAALYLLHAVFVRDLFGGKADDKAVYAFSIVLTAVFFTWVIFAKRPEKESVSVRKLLQERGMDYLQAAAFAGVLLGGIHYMNALYQFWQDLASREVLFWAGLLLLTMGAAGHVLHRGSAVWLAVSVPAGLGYYFYQKARLTGEQAQQALHTLRWDIAVCVVAGLVLLSLLYKIRHKTFAFERVNRIYAAVLLVFLALLVVFRNKRGWPVYLAVVFILFYLFFLGWEKRERLLQNFCGGIVLNFALATIFCMARRPFRAWVYSRYNFVFHTVTITATYLTLVVCALTVRLLHKLKEGKRLTDLWVTLLLYGLSVSFLFLTLSRTGYLAVIAMTAVLLPFVTFVVYRQGWGAFLKNVFCMAAAVILCVPVAYTSVRLLPAVYNDPYIYEVEESSAAIHKDDPKDSNAYMSVSYFKYVMENKLFADASSEREEAGELLLCLQEKPYVRPGGRLVASAEDTGLEEDFSNGRIEIFKSYIREWNLTGHEEMGVLLPDGTLSVHAHNTYLQVIHDHGLITGIAYLLFGLISVCMMFVYAVKRIGREEYAVLPLSIFIGFAVASLVEWLFHPCNPMGFSVMVIFAPLLAFRPGKEKSTINTGK